MPQIRIYEVKGLFGIFTKHRIRRLKELLAQHKQNENLDIVIPSWGVSSLVIPSDGSVTNLVATEGSDK